MRVEPRPRTGLRLLSYAQYDGRPARVVVLGGLEEGGYPAAPPRLDPGQAAIEKALALESQDDELLRAARVAGCAAARASERVILGFSRTDEAGADTFPGALLAAVRRRKYGGPGIAPTAATEATARPATLADISSPADLLAATEGDVAPALAGTPLAGRWARAAAAARHLASVEAERNPEEPAPSGPFTGTVGTDLGAKAYSPSSLEKLGQCAFRYFVERILGAEEAADAGVDLDALETRSLLHLALARAAQDAIAEKGAWVLNAPEDERAAHVERVHREVCGAIDATSAEVLASNPTLSRPLVGHFLARWKRALLGWLEDEACAPVGGAFGPGGAPDPDDLDEETLAALAERTSAAAGAVEAWRKVRRGIALVEAARKKAVDAAEAAARWQQAEVKLLVPKGDFVAAAKEKDAKQRAALLDALAAKVDAAREEKAEALRGAIEKAYEKDREAVPRRAVASEWSFGDEPDPSSDPKSTEKPLEVALPGGRTMAVRGRVDRVDLADDRPDAAVVDYKTGRQKSARALVAEIGEGRHLQLPLYARAVEALLAGKKGVPAKTRAVLGRLDFVRFRAPAQALLEDGAAAELLPAGPDGVPVPGGKALPVQAVVAEHLAYALRRLESGVLPPVPRSCPQTGGVPCPAQPVCGALEASLERILPPEPQPLYVLPPREPAEKKEKPGQQVTYAPARPVPDPLSFEDAKAAHEAGLAKARDVSRDVVVSAGAGSGKTTALVSRYVAALEAGARPAEILCITFTRKATAEMRSRVRERIVDLDRSKVAPEDLARWIAELGTAPIRTIDAFAGEIATELSDEAVEASDAARAFADEFVADRLAAEAEKPGPQLKRLLERLPLAKAKLALARLLEQDALDDEGVEALDADGIVGGLGGGGDARGRGPPGARREAARAGRGGRRGGRRAEQRPGDAARHARHRGVRVREVRRPRRDVGGRARGAGEGEGGEGRGGARGGVPAAEAAREGALGGQGGHRAELPVAGGRRSAGEGRGAARPRGARDGAELDRALPRGEGGARDALLRRRPRGGRPRGAGGVSGAPPLALPVQARPRGRVPGHEHRAVPLHRGGARAARRGAGRQGAGALHGRRSEAVDLPVPRGRGGPVRAARRRGGGGLAGVALRVLAVGAGADAGALAAVRAGVRPRPRSGGGRALGGARAEGRRRARAARGAPAARRGGGSAGRARCGRGRGGAAGRR